VNHRPRRRHVKLHRGNLGPLLCWSIVFADIGTSIYYVPGILSAQGFGRKSAIFVLLTLFVFILLALKYAEVTWRNPEGGGVVTIASRALHPFVGLVGGLFILVDYYLTAAISAYSGISYLAVVAPAVAFGNAVPATLVCIGGLAVLNVIGIRESARVSFVAATVAATGQLFVVLVVAVHLGPDGVLRSIEDVGRGSPALTPLVLITGYAAAFLAFSGLESVAQIAPAMRSPRNVIAYRTMALVIATMALTSPLLTLWSTLPSVLGHDPNAPANNNQLLSLLGGHFAGPALAGYVAVTGSVLLIFASNTAIIGGYHVFLALTRMGFLPRVLERQNAWRHTPHVAILATVSLPVALVYVAGSSGAANVFLGDLYAFGLLGSFILTNVSLDVVRWREMALAFTARRAAIFSVGVLTTLLVLIGWSVNLVAKPRATIFGGGLTLIGLAVGYVTYRRGRQRRPAIFPLPYSPARAAESLGNEFRRRPADVLVILPESPDLAAAVLEETVHRAGGRSAVFLYRGQPHHHPATAQLLEVADPYLKDYAAQDAFARAEQRTRATIPQRRFVYVPGGIPDGILGRVWTEVFPKETIAAQEDGQALPPVALSRVRLRLIDGVTVVHLVTGRLGRQPVPDARLST